MLSLIVIFLFALAVAFFAVQNMFAVPIVFAGAVIQAVPLFLVVIASIIIGIILSSLISSIDNLSAYVKLRGKDNRIHDNEKVIDELQQRVHDLEIENAHMKSVSHPEERKVNPELAQKEDEHHHFRPTFMGGLLHPHVKA